MTPDQFRLDQTQRLPRLTLLSKELHGLRSLTRFMMSGAHPDDECAPMLATLYYRDGVNLSYACSTRGEGGQNDLGTERGADLGALRTAEMEAACDVLNMRMYWLSQSPDDSINDWRFSKSGEETLQVWDHGRTLTQMVNILRRDKPDMLCPTFLDVPGQHGHHRAMTRIAFEAFEAAADPGFKGCDLPAWEVAKLYLPAWSGAGRAYDDDLPPPPATVTIDGGGKDPATGWDFALIGALSHGNHRSQGMGHWPEGTRDFPLHLANTRVGHDTNFVTDNLTNSFADIGLPDIDQKISDAIEASANPQKCGTLLHQILAELQSANVDPKYKHRVDDKIIQLSRLIAINAAEIPVTFSPKIWLCPGTTTQISGLSDNARLMLPKDWNGKGTKAGPTKASQPYQGYRDTYDPYQPPLPAVCVTVEGVQSLWPLSQPLIASPAHSIQLDRNRVTLNIGSGQTKTTLLIHSQNPSNAHVTLALKDGWKATHTEDALTISAPPSIHPGRYNFALNMDNEPAFNTRHINYPHIRPTQSALPAEVQVSVVDVKLPDHPVGYIGAGLDTAASRLSELGMVVNDLSDTETFEEKLTEAPTLLVGIHAFGFNARLAKSISLLHNWVKEGGNLVTLYHRPWDNWDPATTPPYPLEIGQPSLRWRVTHKDAPVEFLAPDHPLLSSPNKITPADFNGWVKERGLYFAKSWDAQYEPLFAVSDPDEDPLKGAMLTAKVGKGQHTHFAFNIHHQLEHDTEGAIRLLANALAIKSA